PPQQLGPDLDAPARDGLLVALDGPLDRHLGGPAQLLEQPPHVALVVADAELLLDDGGDARAGPDLAAEAVGLRPGPEEPRAQPLRGAGQPRRRARAAPGPQRLPTARP